MFDSRAFQPRRSSKKVVGWTETATVVYIRSCSVLCKLMINIYGKRDFKINNHHGCKCSRSWTVWLAIPVPQQLVSAFLLGTLSCAMVPLLGFHVNQRTVLASCPSETRGTFSVWKANPGLTYKALGCKSPMGPRKLFLSTAHSWVSPLSGTVVIPEEHRQKSTVSDSVRE